MERDWPFIDAGDNLVQHIRAAQKFPLLSAEMEQTLSRRWCNHQNIDAARQLVNSHLCLVVKVAVSHRGYGLPVDDLIGEGSLGLMHAVCRFDPGRGVRFATYAIWWIRAAVQEYVLLNWSLVKIGTTTSQKKLFFNLQHIRGHSHEFDENFLKFAHVNRIVDMLQVLKRDVISMRERMTAGPDCSLNVPFAADAQSEWQNLLADDGEVQEAVLAAHEQSAHWMSVLFWALRELTTRERHIIVERRLRKNPVTLENLSQRYGISSERVRQIEVRALEKLHSLMEERSLKSAQSRCEQCTVLM